MAALARRPAPALHFPERDRIDCGSGILGGTRPSAVAQALWRDKPDAFSVARIKPIRPEDGFHLGSFTLPAPRSALAAFTLLELLAGLAIIAILTGLAIGAGHRAGQAGRAARARAELATMAAALENYRRTFGDYPQTDDPARLLQSLIGRRDPLNGIIATRSQVEPARFVTAESHDPFADATAVLLDPWGRPYRYAYRSQAPWTNPGYVLYSTGPDGRDSGSLITGGFTDPAPPENADNIEANR